MDDSSIILVGMMGSGKSFVGERLAEHFQIPFVDTDRLLVQKLGRSIEQMFERYGEESFREHETTVLRNLQPGRYVLSTGGGIVIREANWAEMRRLGTTVFLDVPIDVLIQRLLASRRKRPLLQADHPEERIRAIHASRYESYCRADVHVVLDDGPPEATLAQVLNALGENP